MSPFIRQIDTRQCVFPSLDVFLPTKNMECMTNRGEIELSLQKGRLGP